MLTKFNHMKRLLIFNVLLMFVATMCAQSVDVSNKADARKIDKKGAGFRWNDTNMQISDSELADILGDDLYDTYLSAHNQVSRGNTCLMGGATCLALSIAGLVAYANQPADFTGKKADSAEALVLAAQIVAYGADAFICLGCVFRGIGNGRLRWVRDTYNSSLTHSSTLSLRPSVMVSSQNDLAFGASLNFSF